MFSAFNTALSGLRAHQTLLDVTGNNLANVNTPGFWMSRVVFADMLSQTVRSASAPSANKGGINPSQIGTGVFSQNVEKLTTQGVINSTGRTFDLAIQGSGFFVLNNGNTDVYTRVGTFGLDSNNRLVDTRSGFQVQSTTGGSIQVDFSATDPARATTKLQMAGNLPATITGPVEEILTSKAAFEDGTSAEISGTFAAPPDGDFQVFVDGGASQTISLAGVATITDAITQINAQLTGAMASEDAGSPGTLLITSDSTGEVSSVRVVDGTAGTAAALGFPLATTVRGTQSPATGASELNDLVSNTADYVDGDLINITGLDADGNAVNATFTYGAANDGTTLDDVITAINAAFSGATASLDADGNLVLTANDTGEAGILLTLSDDSASVGSTSFSTHTLNVSQEGTGPDQVVTQVEIFDTQGRSHALTLTYERQEANIWNLTASFDNGDGTLSDATVSGIQFGEDGRILSIADDTRSLSVSFPGLGTPQGITLDFGNDDFAGLTQFGDFSNAFVASQDGYEAGNLAGISVAETGEILGLFSNGQVQSLANIGLAQFTNPEGLTQVGDSLYQVSANSGSAQTLAASQTSSSARIVSGALEGSNVDLTQELVKLILAQRGFQANARSVNSANLILSEAINLVQ